MCASRALCRRLVGSYAEPSLLAELPFTVGLIHAEDGGFSPETYSHIKRLARDASKTGGRDGTEYDDDNWNARSYLTHHMQRISSDIVMATADQLIAAINITKRSATGAAY